MTTHMFIVTIKLRKNPAHNPHDKKLDVCPINSDRDLACTDATGEHHSFLTLGQDVESVREHWKNFYHVTRVETASWDML
jgi:hypothetical protein